MAHVTVNEDDSDRVSESAPLIAKNVRPDLSGEGFFSPLRNFFRYTGLFFICFITFGPYFGYVLPGALEKYFEHDLHIDTTTFTLFTSLYSWPNVVLCFFGGVLIDKVLGVRFGGIIFSTLITFGIFMFAFGAYVDQILIMEIGRFIFGMGGESVAIAQKAYAVEWFTAKELNLVFGLLVVGALSGATINQLVMVPIYEFVETYQTGYKCLGLAIFIGAFTCLFSTICTIITALMDYRREKYLKAKNLDSKPKKPLKSEEEGVKSQDKPFSFKDMVSFPVELWLMFIVCVVFYGITFPFISLGKLYFMRKYDFSQTVAGYQQSLFFLITTVFSPVFGIIVDRTGYNTTWLIASCFIALAAHSVMLFTFVNSFIPVVVLALSLSIVATVLWPAVSDLVPQNKLGSAYGMMQSVQNMGLATISIFTGFLVENYGYMVLQMFFIVLSIIGLVAAFFLYVIDKARGGNLGKSAKQKKSAKPDGNEEIEEFFD